ncbi:VCBS repeat-containing protein [Streptomyces lincolnensis]|nr:VCBS repeat-containing protein [Streptomyces lincolnensis]
MSLRSYPSLRSHVPWGVPLLAGLLVLGAVPPDLPDTDRAGRTVLAPVRDDFDGDGYQDLALGAPRATVGGQTRAGHVVVLYGGPHGVSADRRTVISRATTGIPGSPATSEQFGLQLSKGDLDGDGRAELVVGTSGGKARAVVVWGGPRGLTGGTSVPAAATRTGDFDGDGRLDLALFAGGRSPGDDPLGTTATVWTGPVSRSGTPARTSGLDAEHLRYQDVWDGAVGDVNADGRDDLVLKTYLGEGAFGTRFYLATARGLTAADFPGGDGGFAFGDLNGDGYDDLAVGATADRGKITVAPGSAAGLKPRSAWKTYTQDTPGVPGTAETGDYFGADLSAGDVTGDGIDDLAVGAPGEELGYDDGAGAVTLLRGSRTGPTGTGAQLLTQDTKGVTGTSEPGDGFGGAVRLLDINGNGHADLTASAPGEDSGNGRAWVLRGRPTGVVTDAALVVDARTVGAPYAKALFGAVVR